MKVITIGDIKYELEVNAITNLLLTRVDICRALRYLPPCTYAH